MRGVVSTLAALTFLAAASVAHGSVSLLLANTPQAESAVAGERPFVNKVMSILQETPNVVLVADVEPGVSSYELSKALGGFGAGALSSKGAAYAEADVPMDVVASSWASWRRSRSVDASGSAELEQFVAVTGAGAATSVQPLLADTLVNELDSFLNAADLDANVAALEGSVTPGDGLIHVFLVPLRLASLAADGARFARLARHVTEDLAADHTFLVLAGTRRVADGGRRELAATPVPTEYIRATPDIVVGLLVSLGIFSVVGLAVYCLMSVQTPSRFAKKNIPPGKRQL